MTDLEYDVLDELYFVIHFEDLLKQTQLDETILKKTLQSLCEKNWVRCFVDLAEEVPAHWSKIEAQCDQYFYLATKEGLMAHNRM
jgi:hypothetical protein